MRRQLLSFLAAATVGVVALQSGTASAQQQYRGYLRPGYNAPGNYGVPASYNPFNVSVPGTVSSTVRLPVSGLATFPNNSISSSPAFSAGTQAVSPRMSGAVPGGGPPASLFGNTTPVPDATGTFGAPITNPNAPNTVPETVPVEPNAAPIEPAPNSSFQQQPNSSLQQQPLQGLPVQALPIQQQFIRPSSFEPAASVGSTGFYNRGAFSSPSASGYLYSPSPYQSSFYAPLVRVYGSQGY